MMNDITRATTSSECRFTHERPGSTITTLSHSSSLHTPLEEEVARFMEDLAAARLISGLKQSYGGHPGYQRISLSPDTAVGSDTQSDNDDVDGEPMDRTPPPSLRSSPVRSMPSKTTRQASRKLNLRQGAIGAIDFSEDAKTKKASPSFSSVSMIKGKLVRPEGFKTKKRKAWFDWEEAILDRAVQNWVDAADGRSRDDLKVFSLETTTAWDQIADACLTCGVEKFCRGRQGILTKAAKAPYFRPSARSATSAH